MSRFAMTLDLKNKRVLVLNLGLLGGGVATTNWLLEQGARVTVTDLADAKVLAPSVKRVEDHLKKIARDGKSYDILRARLTWALGKHSQVLVDGCDVLVINPSVPVNHPYVRRAQKRGILVVNEGTMFYDRWKKKTVGVTGTRGKTTTATWTHHLIDGSVLTGNSVMKPFQSAMDARAGVAVTELSSFILELFPSVRRGPQVAVITNLYCDHLNRHKTMQGYAKAKAAIFMRQKPSDVLILNHRDSWTPWFLKQRPRAAVQYFSFAPLTGKDRGVWYDQHHIMLRTGGRDRAVLDVVGFEDKWGRHNVANVMGAALAANASGVPWQRIQQRLTSLPQVPFRQEVVFKSTKLAVVNDTTATSPEGGIAALRRWGGPNCILICGGTDRELDYRGWAQELPKHITKNNLIFLAGSATTHMKKELGKAARGVRTYDTLERAWQAAQKRAGLFVSSVVLFSPAAKSFELFKNEFDRGEKFNALVERDLPAARRA